MACQKRCHELFFFLYNRKILSFASLLYHKHACRNSGRFTIFICSIFYAHAFFIINIFRLLSYWIRVAVFLFIYFFFLLLSPNLRVIIVAVVVAGPKSPFLYFARAYDESHYRPQSLSGPVVSACIYVCAISNVCDPVYKTIKRRHTFISSKRKKKKNFMSQFFPSP